MAPKYIIAVALWSGVGLHAAETNWGQWGPDDQLGTLNYITPEVVRHAATLVKQARVFSLALPLAANQAGAANRRLERYMLTTGQGTGSRPAWIGDNLSLPIHGTTHWDGLAHVFGDGKMYNGYDVETYVTPAGALKNGIDRAARKLVSRGVLLDVARYKGVPRLEAGYVITPADLEGAARKQGVSFREGDILLIRTGWITIFREKGREAFESGEPGIGWEAAQWLKKRRAAAVASDNEYLEVMPAEPGSARKAGQPALDRPVHYELIRNQGMTVGELFYLEDLAKACAGDASYEFLLVAQPMKLINATGSPISPLAVK